MGSHYLTGKRSRRQLQAGHDNALRQGTWISRKVSLEEQTLLLEAVTVFSSHALDRVFERMKLPPEQVAETLNTPQRRVVFYLERAKKQKTSTKYATLPKGRVRAFVVFFSWVDRAWYVAIQDLSNGTVITVQHPWQGYHRLHLTARHLTEALAKTQRQLTFMGRTQDSN